MRKSSISIAFMMVLISTVTVCAGTIDVKVTQIDVVKKGRIDKKYMQEVSFPGVSRTRFQKQANYFWETLDGKARYLKEVPKLNT